MRKALSIAMVCLSLAAATLAQVTTGRIEGTVTDPQGAAVPGAQIKVVNKLTGQTLESLPPTRRASGSCRPCRPRSTPSPSVTPASKP